MSPAIIIEHVQRIIAARGTDRLGRAELRSGDAIRQLAGAVADRRRGSAHLPPLADALDEGRRLAMEVNNIQRRDLEPGHRQIQVPDGLIKTERR